MGQFGAIQKDGFANAMTGMGGRSDKVRATQVDATGHRPGYGLLEILYESDGLARRVIDAPAEAMTREWIELPDLDGVAGILEAANVKQGVTDTLRWARLYGGCIGVIGLDDGTELSEPVNEGAISNLLYLRPYDRWQTSVTTGDLDDDPRSQSFGQPIRYRVSPATGGQPFTVHHSRVIRMDGDPLPDRRAAINDYWGAPVLWACYESIRDLAVAYHAAAVLIQEFNIKQLGIENLSDLLQTEEGERELSRRLELLDISTSYIKHVVTDAAESYARHTATVTGMPELLDKEAERLSSVTGIPVTVLMGRSPAGMNATGDSDLRNWYDTIRAEQEDRLRPQLEKIIRYAVLARFRREPEDWHFTFRSLYAPTEKEAEETLAIKVQRMEKMIFANIIDPQEARAEMGYDG